jgi:hypothetical protein
VHKSYPADHPAVSLHAIHVLEGVARRLAAKYPPDWLERHAGPLYWAAVGACFLAAVLSARAWGPWPGFTVALLGPSCLLVVLPRLLFGRTTGRPRWAHRLAVLDERDAALVRSLGVGAPSLDAISGERFFAIRRRAHCLADSAATKQLPTPLE